MGLTLNKLLIEKGYIAIPLELTLTQHLIVQAKINGIEGRFILDSGASNTCVGIEWITYFNLKAEESEIKAAGAGASAMETQVAIKNHLEIGSLSIHRIPLVLFNLTHVNEALEQFNLLPVHGVIGADLLLKKKAVIDYSKKKLYLLR